MKNSKAKGNRFELEVAKKMSKWSGKEFHRTPSSGALHWANDTRVVSDIVSPQDTSWAFSIECKNVMYDWDFSALLKKTSTFWEHWGQCLEDAEREKRVPMMVFKKNYRPIYVALKKEVADRLDLGEEQLVLYTKGSEPVVISGFDEFLERNTFENLTSGDIYKFLESFTNK